MLSSVSVEWSLLEQWKRSVTPSTCKLLLNTLPIPAPFDIFQVIDSQQHTSRRLPWETFLLFAPFDIVSSHMCNFFLVLHSLSHSYTRRQRLGINSTNITCWSFSEMASLRKFHILSIFFLFATDSLARSLPFFLSYSFSCLILLFTKIPPDRVRSELFSSYVVNGRRGGGKKTNFKANRMSNVYGWLRMDGMCVLLCSTRRSSECVEKNF